MRPGMQPLLQILRGDALGGDLNRTQCRSLLLLAEQENILPWVSARLRAGAGRLDPEFETTVDEIDRDARVSAFFWSSTLRGILSDFHRCGIPVISLKGPWLADRLYGDVALRACRDLDLLVRRDHISAAEKLLSEIGFSPAGCRQDYERPWRRNNVRVELHHDVENPLAFDFGIEAAWRRSRPAAFQGISARLLSEPDELLFLCLHGVRHRFERLSHFLDLVIAFREHAAQCAAIRAECSSESANILALGAMLANRLDPNIVVPCEVYDALPDRNHLERIAGLIWRERTLIRASTVNWSAKHRFYLEIEASSWKRFCRRFRHFRILLSRLIDADFAFAARLHLYRTWQVRLLRPIRLLLNSAWVSPTL